MTVVRREHRGAARTARLTVLLGDSTGNLTITCDDLTGWPTGSVGPFFAVLDEGESNEEKVLCVSRSGNVLTVYSSSFNGRAQDNTTIAEHSVNAVIAHCITAQEMDESNDHIMATEAHGSSGAIVGLTTLTATLASYLTTAAAAAAYVAKSLLTTTGDIIYASATSTPARLGIGSTGQVLTVAAGVPSWATPGLPGLDCIAVVAVAGETSKSLANDTFVADTDYLIVIEGTSLIAGVVTHRFRAAGVDDSSSNYSRTVIANATVAVQEAGQTAGRTNNTAVSGGAETLTVYRPADAAYTVSAGRGIVPDASNFATILDTANVHRVASAFDSMTFFFSSAFTGDIRVYKMEATVA